MDFGQALRHLKDGHRVAREGWNGKGMWLSYTPSREVTPDQFWSPANAEWAASRAVQARVRDYITMKTADDEIVPWVASQTDMLAEDWVLPDAVPTPKSLPPYTRGDMTAWEYNQINQQLTIRLNDGRVTQVAVSPFMSESAAILIALEKASKEAGRL